ncbi:ATP/GTP-binding protein [Streptomyces albireticuli]|uniref:ATP/GTP-binding protein n=1 Tax=Streptomyces albireticuli TaxID=1940 RepID=A0A2A2D5T1_9ACTN|nr:ATP/GTP-binding protein [Streptomyces albireticuli]MCD9144290.1 ATP/GTP-binding protein [Streptomyces albireticuli]MCD9162067.1 ATP/GTP-binding protein [Streptomyces albireticuli]MCD9193927.1 ATP/GTP-binding protein [Streptomyces albireticuli]PAU46871.1 ATP/GTP-binding protein [Streptomyces albireticuli]
MSPRRNRPRGGPERAADVPREAGGGDRYGLERAESWQGEEWAVRTVSGGSAAKHYRCPGCDQEIPPGVPHLVAWPQYGGGVEDRRHWHKACWNAKDRRSARLQRSRNAPRY